MAQAPIESDIRDIASLLGTHIQRFSGKHVLISGGCGFLGRYFVELFAHANRHLLKYPCEVTVLDTLITSQRGNEAINHLPHTRWIEHDVTTPYHPSVPPHFIIHMAGIASPFYYRKYPLQTLEVATVGTKLLLELARQHRVEGFLFFSSSEIYGDPDPGHVPTNEAYRGNVSCLGPRACYDESKRIGETLCTIYHGQFGVPATIVRPFNIYGPGMRETDYRVLPNFASNIVAGTPLKIYSDGKQTRTFSYISDGLNGFLRTLLIGSHGEAYNIGHIQPEVSMVDLHKELVAILGKPIEAIFVEHPDSYPPDEPLRRCPDITKARRQLGFEPSVSLQDGLRRFMDWALSTYTGK